MKSRYIVSYDVSDARRLRLVHRKMCGYGDPLHYSVFRCDLSPSDKILLLEDLSALINHHEDRIMIIDIGPTDGRGRESVENDRQAIDHSGGQAYQRDRLITCMKPMRASNRCKHERESLAGTQDHS